MALACHRLYRGNREPVSYTHLDVYKRQLLRSYPSESVPAQEPCVADVHTKQDQERDTHRMTRKAPGHYRHAVARCKEAAGP